MRHEITQTQTTLHAQRRTVRTRRRGKQRGLPARSKTHAEQVRDRRWRILLLLTMALGFELAAASLTSPLLGINRIQVRNTESLLPTEITATNRIAALPAGSNLLRAPLGQMEQSLRALPWIQSAKIVRLFPHGLRVQVTPRQPAVIAQIGAQRFELDANAVPIRLARTEMADSLPLIVMDRVFQPRFGAAIQDEAVQAAIKVYRDARQQTMLHIAKIEVDQNGNICLNMKDTVQIQIGQTDDLEGKMNSLQHIYEQDPNVARRMAAINLSCPNQPACTPRNPVPMASGMQTDSFSAQQPGSSKSPGKPAL